MSVIDGKFSSPFPLLFCTTPQNTNIPSPGTHFSNSSAASVNGLTRAMILHPIACALAFIAFGLSCGAGVVGSILGASVAAVAWALTLVVMAIDFSIFGVSRSSYHWLYYLRSLPLFHRFCFLLSLFPATFSPLSNPFSRHILPFNPRLKTHP